MVELLPSKQVVAGSNPVSRSNQSITCWKGSRPPSDLLSFDTLYGQS